jgi:Interleukin-like EMT inducer
VEVRFNDRLLATHEGPARQAIDLAPPYRPGDRNELSFTHVYTIDPSARERREYRIGATGVHAPVDITAVSAAKPYGNRASIRVNGRELIQGVPRGYVVAALDPGSGQPIRLDSFDTFVSAAEAGQMARFIESLPSGTIVVAAARDEASGQLEETAVRALRSVGARADLRGRPWTSHALIGVAGAKPGHAVEQAGPGLLQVSVGRTAPLEVTLEAFELR